MSRIGQNPVSVPDGVDVNITGQIISAKGKLGELSLTLVDEISIDQDGNKLTLSPKDNSKRARTMWGTSRSLVQNIVTGVSEGFTINMEIVGVGYRAALQGKNLVLQLGYSHEIQFPIPGDITITCERPTAIAISGADKQKVGHVASQIRGLRPPEPYKGKGVRYSDEFVLRKEGKKK
ncbi:MAG: 50S ribosomal protein L6 [Rhodospirillaceae bacterium]|nr:50S ribosomal protein L6 [Rhodospirillaceae bacterium]|tara:strand:+ start:1864 stop:2397 length:534 start_codon:yes stop_codon:yes gene_type:complete